VLFFGIIAVVGLAGCSAGSQASGAVSAVAQGQALVEQKCSVCHALDRVNAAQKDRASWVATVDRMRGHGANLTDAEAALVVDYLASRPVR
jgi:mono/diheme cytochrome c family protein